MLEIIHLLMVFGIGVVSAFIGSLCGGGGGMITVPWLIFLWLWPVQAVATMTVSAIGDSLWAIYRFRWSGKFIRKHIILLVVMATVWSILWIQFLVSIDESLLMRIIGILLLLLLPILFLKAPTHWWKKQLARQKVLWAICLLAIGVYTTFFWANAWFFMLYTLMYLFHYPIVNAHAMSKLFFLIVNIAALPIILSKWLVSFSTVAVLFIGMFIGSYLGAHTMLKMKSVWVKRIMAIMVVFAAVKILFFS